MGGVGPSFGSRASPLWVRKPGQGRLPAVRVGLKPELRRIALRPRLWPPAMAFPGDPLQTCPSSTSYTGTPRASHSTLPTFLGSVPHPARVPGPCPVHCTSWGRHLWRPQPGQLPVLVLATPPALAFPTDSSCLPSLLSLRVAPSVLPRRRAPPAPKPSVTQQPHTSLEVP